MTTPSSPMDGWGVMQRAVDLSRSGEPFALATVVWRQGPSSGHSGSRAIVTASGEVHGWVGGACAEPVLVREALEVIADGEPRLIWLGRTEDLDAMHVPNGVITVPISCQSDGALQIYIEPAQNTPHLVVVGRSPMAATLVEMARLLDWRVELLDGPEFSSSSITDRSVVVVATQGHGDEDVLLAAAAVAPAYLGVVASARRAEALRGFLADHGVDAAALDAMHVPVGLDLGRTTHREVAVSILADLVRRRAAGEFPSGGAPVTARRVEAIDPVCGMTVAAHADSRPLEHDGVTYYFCCPGCRYAFERDPAAHLAQEATC
ncbi:MAG: XdhC family protein [Ilumatobacteraceae bacterium]